MPLVLLACILPRRSLKGWLINSQYFYKAEEGKIGWEFRRNTQAAAKNETPINKV
ncbi:hypothetical protein SZ54_5052 [Rhizobium sp. UR51a]|nr:hypothetical protein SZ54_5052 [Rhizobium sp. UR51a]